MRTTPCIAGLVLALVLGSGCSTSPNTSPAEAKPAHPHHHGDGHTHDHRDTDVVVEELVRSTHSWNGTTLPAYPDGQPEIVVLRVTVPPHTALPWHKHPVINAGVLVSGTLTVMTPDGPSKRLHAGDALIELVDQPHRGVNDSNQPTVVYVVYAGTTGGPITVPADVDP
ncbi:MAG: cupin domain-containing protein [Planctomycetota bacterium]